MQFGRFRVFVDVVKEGKGFERDGEGGVIALFVPDMKKKLTWVKMANTTYM
jgi:hypothetical protein